MTRELTPQAPAKASEPAVHLGSDRAPDRSNQQGPGAISRLHHVLGNRQVAKLAQARRLTPAGQILQRPPVPIVVAKANAGTPGEAVDGLAPESQALVRIARMPAQLVHGAPALSPGSLHRQTRPAPAGDDLANRVAVLERQQAASELDLRWRAQFGSRLSVYRQAIYALTTAFRAAVTNFGQAHNDQAQAEAMKDQVAMAIINVGAAGAAEPFLRSALGGLGSRLAAMVETVENPAIQAAQGVTAVATTVSSQTGSQRPATTPPPGMVGGDPLTFLTQNLQEVEHRNELIESAFANRATRMQAFSSDQWLHWDRAPQEAQYAQLLHDLDAIALSDVAQLEAALTLAVKVELYFWSRWLVGQYIPGVRGLQIGAHLAKRMRAIGVESLAGGIHFDTTSWIFMDHQPRNWDEMLVNWARGYGARLTR